MAPAASRSFVEQADGGYGAIESQPFTASLVAAANHRRNQRKCDATHALPILTALALTVAAAVVVSGGYPAPKAAEKDFGDTVNGVVGDVMDAFGMHGNSAEPIKSIVDERQFRFVSLDNGLDALLISDPTTDESAAAMDVGFGSWDEPEDVPGLAHFCEHMSFMGSEKYPDTDAYGHWIGNHGGGTNAYTGNENTNYYFGVQPDALASTLDRFAQFFISPLFANENVYKEMHAVNSENENDRNKDGWRVEQVLSHTANPAHPASRATIGSITTLNRTDARDRLVAFHSKYYVASAMKLVVMGREPLDDLESLVKEGFAPVPEGERPAHDWMASTALPYPENSTGTLVKVQTQVSTQEIAIHWYLGPEHTNNVNVNSEYRQSPFGFLDLLMSDDSEKSLSELLKAKGLANGVSASHETNSAYAMYSISGSLTDQGFGNYSEVVGIIFDYVDMLRHADPAALQERWEEIHQIAAVEFQYQEPDTSADSCSGLAADLQTLHPEDILGSPEHFEWNGDIAASVLAALTPERAMIHLLSDKFDPTTLVETEPWFGTKYSKQPLQTSLISRASTPQNQPLFALLPKNVLLATDLSILAPADPPQQEGIAPELLRHDNTADTPEVQVWWRQESVKIPTILLEVAFFSDVSFESAETSTLTQLYTMVADESMSDFRDMASLAGFSCRLSPLDQAGFALSVSGYSDPEKFDTFLKMVLDHMSKPTISEARFTDLLDLMRQDAEGYKVWQAYEQASYFQEILTGLRRVTVEQTRDELNKNITLASLNDFIARLFQKGEGGRGIAQQVLVYGNTDRATALRIADVLQTLGDDQPLSAEVAAAAPAANGTRRMEANDTNATAAVAVEANATAEVAAPTAEAQAVPAPDTTAPDTATEVAATPLTNGTGTYSAAQKIIAPLVPVMLGAGESLVYQAKSLATTDDNNAARSTFQFGRVGVALTPGVEPSDKARKAMAAAIRLRVTMQLIDNFLGGSNVGGPVFEQLRSVEQLGYIAGDVTGITANIGSITFVVQGTVKDASYMDGRIADFVTKFYNQTLSTVTEEKFGRARDVLKQQYLARAVSMGERAERIWGPIADQNYHFTRRELALAMLDELTIAEMQQVYYITLINGTKLRHISSEVFGASSEVIAPAELSATVATKLITGPTASLLDAPIDGLSAARSRWPMASAEEL